MSYSDLLQGKKKIEEVNKHRNEYQEKIVKERQRLKFIGVNIDDEDNLH